jgi:hypothetical protein
MASVASQFIEEVTAHAQKDSLEDAREICADGSYFPNNQRSSGCLPPRPPAIRPHDELRATELFVMPVHSQLLVSICSCSTAVYKPV